MVSMTRIKPYFDTVVANRLPYRMEPPELNLGGVVSACISMMARGSTWYGVDDGSAVHDKLRREKLPRGRGHQKRIRLSRADASGHYHWISNGVLWPVHHGMPQYIWGYNDERREQYDDVNRIFAEEVKDGKRIFVNDYHFMLLPGMIKENNPESNVAFFLHTPMWDLDTYDQIKEELPDHIHLGIQRLMRYEIERTLLGADLVGLQIPPNVHDYVEAVKRFFQEADIKESSDGSFSIDYKSSRTLVDAFPVGIDPTEIRAYTAEGTEIKHIFEDGTDLYEEIEAAKRAGLLVAAKVGRLDYTKGFVEDMLIAEQLSLMGVPIKYFVIGAPTRESHPAYLDARSNAIKTAEKINNRNRGKLGYDLIFFRDESMAFGESLLNLMKVPLYLDASLADGMHLTPKEAIEAKAWLPYKNRGIVVVGENTGVGWQYSNAGLGPEDGMVIIDPSDVKRSAKKIKDALDAECNVSHKLIRFGRKYDASHWATGIEEGVEKA